VILSGSKSVSDQINVGLSRFDSGRRLLLKAVQYINGTATHAKYTYLGIKINLPVYLAMA
jgi:hypothetical protein